MNKKISFALGGFALFCIFLSLVLRIFFVVDNESLLHQMTGIDNSHLFSAGIVMFLIAFLINDFMRPIFIDAFMDQSGRNNAWLYSNTIKKPTVFLAVNVIIFAAFSLYYFDAIKHLQLFVGVDGDYSVTIAAQQKLWMDKFYAFGANFEESLGGNIWFPLNTRVDPGYIIGGLFGPLNYAVAHTIWALLLFGSTLVLARVIGLNWATGTLAAWLTPCLILYISPFKFSTVPLLIPHMATTIAVTSLILAVVLMMRYSLKASILRGLGLTALILYFAISNPTFLLLSFPIIAFCGLAKLIVVPTHKERLIEIAVCALPLLFIVAIGCLSFVAGLYLDTAVYAFPNDFVVLGKSIRAISSFFVHPLVVMLFILCFIGMGIAILHRNIPYAMKALAMALGVMCLLIFTLGPIYIHNPEIWDGPSPNYFEFALWPLYCIFIAYFVVRVTSLLKLERLPISEAKKEKAVCLLMYSPAIALAAFFLLLSVNAATLRYWEFPPPASPIMTKLDDIALNPGEEFKGRAATFTGLNIKQAVSWKEVQKFDYEVLSTFKNDFRKAGLWFNRIPTLTEYNQLLSPRFHYFSKNILGIDGDQQVRNIMTLRHIDPKYLRLMGVTRLITDHTLDGYKLLESETKDNKTVYLYELNGANLTGWSPRNVETVSNFADGMKRLKDDGFNPARSLIVEAPLEQTHFEPATDTTLSVGKSLYKISAKSAGTSLLLLPIEYSSCFTLKAESSGSIKPQMFPGDLLFVTILFEKNIDATLEYRNGPFTNPGCRLKDYTDFKKAFPIVK